MTTTAKSVAIIMDGNRRWAKERNLNPWDGHRKGAETLTTIADAAREQGIAHLIFYTLSTENWKRDPEEIRFLLDLLKEFFSKYIDEAVTKKVRIRIAGQRERFPEDMQYLFQKAEEKTIEGTDGTVWLALSYGGRAEILKAANELVQSGATKVSEEEFEKHLWTAGMPDPDILIRTGGEKRLSGFLPWQSVYSELFFVDVYWPDFSKEDFTRILEEFTTRERRNGA